MKKENLTNRVIMAIVGILVIGLGVGMIQFANLGLDPFTSSVTGLVQMSGLSFGRVYPIVTGLIMVVIFIAEKSLIGVVTFLNVILIGPLADYSFAMLNNLITSHSLAIRILVFILSLILIGLGVSLCNNSDLGTGPYDTLQLIMVDKMENMDFKKSRIICDLVCLVIAIIGRVKLGIGTVITAFFMGPIVGFFDKNVSYKINKRKVTN